MLQLVSRLEGIAPLPSRAAVTSPMEVRADAGAATIFPFGGIGGFGGGFNPDGYAAAGYSDARGYVYFPNLNTTRELSPYTRTEILRRARFLVRNTGLARRIVRGLSRMIISTGLKARCQTRDKDWNQLMQARLDLRHNSKEILDVGGRWNYRQAQLGRMISWLTDGDFITAYVKSKSGGARFRHYEAHQIGGYAAALGGWGSVNPATPADASWIDGVRVDRNNRPMAYRVYGAGPDEYKDIPASASSFLVNYESVGAVRGASIFIHAIPHMLDWVEIESALKRDLKAVADKGYVITEDNAAANDTGGANERFRAAGIQVKNPQTGQRMSLAQLFGGGVVETLKPGQKIEVIADERPHENTMAFADSLVRSVAYGAELAPEIIWKMVNLGSIGGRLLLADLQNLITSKQQDFVDCALAREHAFECACEIAAGNVPPCQDPEFWRCGFITPARYTIDFTKDGNLLIDQIKAGLISPQRGGLVMGFDAVEEGYERIDFVRAMKDYGNEKGKTPVTLLEAFPGQYIGLRQEPDAGAAGRPPGAPGSPAPAPAKKGTTPDPVPADEGDEGDPGDVGNPADEEGDAPAVDQPVEE